MTDPRLTTSTDTGVTFTEPPEVGGPPGRVTRVFSFGYGHTCPFTGESVVHKHVTVIAASAAQCRDLMVATFGLQWAMEYTSLDAATRNGQFPSTEHARLVLPGPDTAEYGRAVDNGDPAAEVPSGVEGGPVTGRATVPTNGGGE